MAEWLQRMTGCSREQAEEAMRLYTDEIYLALEYLMPRKETPGDKYIPPKPRVDTGLSPEQQERCQKGRELQDKVNAVFSVAHSQKKTQPAPLEPLEQSVECLMTAELAAQSSASEQGLDVHEKTTQ